MTINEEEKESQEGEERFDVLISEPCTCHEEKAACKNMPHMYVLDVIQFYAFNTSLFSPEKVMIFRYQRSDVGRSYSVRDEW